MAAVPAPICVQPSGNFRGDDGSWSTFKIKAGNPAQDVEVLVSTLIPETYIISNQGCNKESPQDCSTSRGGLFYIQNSTTWEDQKIYTLVSETNLGFNSSNAGDYGYDALSVPSSNGDVTLNSQILTTIATPQFWLGNLGISPRQINYNGNGQPSYITNLNSTNKIPSLSYGYTAGASYQSNTTASLTFGGYDQSRFDSNGVYFTFSSDPDRDLLVGLQSITYSDSKVASTPLLPQTLFALIDSTVPDLWLPVEACTAFEKAFGISWDPLHLKYLINDTVHDTLLKQNASVKFQLGNAVDSGPTVDIVLPYASFDLQLGPPILPNVTRYFPLRQAQDSSQYTLGRTFLQEAYVTADYERKNFSISQCTWPAPKNANIITIPRPSSTRSGTATVTSASANPTGTATNSAKPTPSVITITQSHSLGTSAIAGIAIAVLIIAILSASTALYMLWWRPRHRKQDSTSTSSCWGSRKNKDDPLPPELSGGPTSFYDPKRGSYFDPVPGAGAGAAVGHKANKPSETISEVEGTFGMASMSPQIIHSMPVELDSDDIRPELESPEAAKRKSTVWTNHLELPSPNPSSIGSGPSPPDQECPEDRLSQILNSSDAGRTMYPIPSPETEQGSFAGSFRPARAPTPSAFQSPQITHTRFGSHGSEVGSMNSNPGAFELDNSRMEHPSPQPSPRPDEPLMGEQHLLGGK